MSIKLDKLEQKTLGAIVEGMAVVGSIFVIVMTVIICADLLSRNLLNVPIYATPNIAGDCVVAIVFLQLGSTIRRGRLMRAELFIDAFVLKNPLAGRYLEVFFHLLGFVVCATLAYGLWPRLASDWVNGFYKGIPGFFVWPEWPLKAVVLLGIVVAALQFLVIAVEILLGSRKDAVVEGSGH